MCKNVEKVLLENVLFLKRSTHCKNVSLVGSGEKRKILSFNCLSGWPLCTNVCTSSHFLQPSSGLDQSLGAEHHRTPPDILSPNPNKPKLFLPRKGDLHNIRLVVLIFWPNLRHVTSGAADLL